MVDVREFVGKPFAWGGRGPNAYDCWGLCKAVLRKMGQYPPDYPSDECGCTNAAHLDVAASSSVWQKLDRPEIGAVVAFRMNLRLASHVGVVVARDAFLHAIEPTGVVIERLSQWERRAVGYYRLRKVLPRNAPHYLPDCAGTDAKLPR